jgi:hypothetical protein
MKTPRKKTHCIRHYNKVMAYALNCSVSESRRRFNRFFQSTHMRMKHFHAQINQRTPLRVLAHQPWYHHT